MAMESERKGDVVNIESSPLCNDDQVLLYTPNDKDDMRRMGKIPQLRRNFRQLSTVSLICVLVSTWEVLFLANDQGLTDGGLAGLFWSYVWTFVGFGLIAASLAEMASMAPTDGGMYHWVSEFAPPQYQKFMSYLTGWMATLSWQAGNASGAFIAGTVIQAILTVDDPTYNPTNWQGTLFVFATVLLIFLVNVFLIRLLPLIQNALMCLHVSAFFAVMLVLWIKAPLNSADKVFTSFTDSGSWSSTGLSVMVGQITAIYGLVGSDTAAHMAEETRDAGVAVPKAMLWSFILNALMGFVFLITMLFTITSIDDALNDPSGYSFIYMLKQALPNSPAGIKTITAILIILSLASNISFNTSTSRQTFAFARDGGLPFSAWISRVHPRLLIPVNAVALSCVISCLLALINIGSDVAFNAIISLFLVALMFTYLVCIGCVLYRRLVSGEHALPSARWRMGRRTGVAINTSALLYCAFAFFWCFWPNTPLTPGVLAGSTFAENFNWSSVIFVGVFLLALLLYIVQGRKQYRPPVLSVVRMGEGSYERGDLTDEMLGKRMCRHEKGRAVTAARANKD